MFFLSDTKAELILKKTLQRFSDCGGFETISIFKDELSRYLI